MAGSLQVGWEVVFILKQQEKDIVVFLHVNN